MACIYKGKNARNLSLWWYRTGCVGLAETDAIDWEIFNSPAKGTKWLYSLCHQSAKKISF